MRIRIAPILAFFSILTFFAWMVFGAPAPPSESDVQGPPLPSTQPQNEGPESADEEPVLRERTAGSIVPCSVPLSWYIARVDESFGLSRAEARAALTAAATLWEDAVGSDLLSNEPGGDLSVRLVFDERQKNRRIVLELDEAEEQLEARWAELEEVRNRLQEAFRGLERRVASLNDTIREWNERGGAPTEVQARLATAGNQLDAERGELAARGREADALGRELEADFERLEREMDAQEKAAEALLSESPARPRESGVYRETVHVQDGGISSIVREIRIYQFDGSENLVLIAAHELGHALGLGHDTVQTSIMREEFTEADLVEGATSVGMRDVEVLRSLCPDL